MKHFIKLFLVLIVVLTCFASQAKDGPFPIYASVGTWGPAQNGYKVQINIWKFVDHEKVMVRVILRDSQDLLFASGLTVHSYVNASLDLNLTTVKGEKLHVSLKPEYRLDTKTSKNTLELKFNMIELDSNKEPSVPSILNKLQ